MTKVRTVLAILLCMSIMLGVLGCSPSSTNETDVPTDAQPTDAEVEQEEEQATDDADAEVESETPDASGEYKDRIIIGVANDITTLDPQGSNTDANMMAFTLTRNAG